MVLFKEDLEFIDDTIIWYKREDVVKELEKRDKEEKRLREIIEAQKEIIKAKDIILKGVVY